MTAEEIIQLIKDQYYLCPNIQDDVCYTWWKHDECETLRSLLYTVTKDEKYKEPLTKLRPSLNEKIYDKDIIERLKRMEENGI